MAGTQAIFYRDKHGREPVAQFIDALPPKRAAKIDAFLDEHLNGRPLDAPPPEFPLTSQIEGELRELRIRFVSEAGEDRGRRSEAYREARDEYASRAGTTSRRPPVLKRILAVLDEELLIGIERKAPDEEPECEVAPAPGLAAA